MNITKPVHEIFKQMRAFFLADPQREFSSEEPFRAELFSASQMRVYGEKVAASHVLAYNKRNDLILERLDDNEDVLLKVYDILVEAVKEKMPITPASEWFLDNFYLIKEQIALGRKHLPKEYSHTLPVLASGKSQGLPRVYDMALEIIAHNDGRVDVANLTTFIESYQQHSVLNIGELWAVPIMLRLGLIENIRRIASRIAISRIDKNVAAYWADQLLDIAQKSPNDIVIVLAEMTKSGINYTSAFVAEFTRRLQGKGAMLSMAITLLEQRLFDLGYSIEEMINIENQRQAVDQVSIRNSIESIRLIKTTDWREFVESVSVVEKILRNEPGGVYAQMDFSTRDVYRHVIEQLGKKSRKEEHEIARLAVELTRQSIAQNKPLRQQHVGYFLVDDKGQSALVKRADVYFSFKDQFKKALKFNRLFSYVVAQLLIAVLFSLWVASFVYDRGLLGWSIVTAVLSFSAFSHLASVFVNWVSTIMVTPKPLPRMDFSDGIPKEYSTLVAVPSMLTSRAGISELVAQLEVRYLANPGENLYYALVTDFADAPTETTDKDEMLVLYAQRLMKELNARHVTGDEQDRFFLFHRPRKWNPREKVWMGYERKRGKLAELNRLLRDGDEEGFSVIVGEIDHLRDIRYVITLDADTQLPRESAWQMVATMAHPLNHAVVNERKRRVVEGYGILQPRVALSLPNSGDSIYAKMHAGEAGLDPYSRLVSDVYQDLFYEGSFIGKGIYDLNIFEMLLGNRFPDNRILSHDLLEGSYVRSGLLADVLLFEEYPDTYWADASRQHRWIRGDWQIAAWATPFVPDYRNKLTPNPLSSLSVFKILDNLRRSLAPITVMLLMMTGWLFLPRPWLWTGVVLFVYFLTPLLSFLWQIFFQREPDVPWRISFHNKWDNFKVGMRPMAFQIVCLPYQAYRNADAIIRSLWRVLISRRHLLQWTPFSSLPKNNKSIADAFRYMWAGTFIALLGIVLIIYFSPQALPAALPFLFLWALSPLVAWWVSKPGTETRAKLSREEKSFAYITARKTWAFFEDFVTEKDNWLPPDNFQEKPVAVTAHRTSPTNIGLALLSDLAAFDFGYLSANQLIERQRKTFATLNSLERFRGHFYNWYDTLSLEPLRPVYISMVDSGNFIASLLTLRQGLIELPLAPIFSPRFFFGIRDTINVAKKDMKGESVNLLKQLENLNEGFIEKQPDGLHEIINGLNMLLSAVQSVKEKMEEEVDVLYWLGKLEKQITDVQEDFSQLMPWTKHLPVKIDLPIADVLNKVPTFRDICQFELKVIPVLETQLSGMDVKDIALQSLVDDLRLANRNAWLQMSALEQLINECLGFSDVEYDFLFDKKKDLFRIGYNVSDDVEDKSYYDMLASEARLGIFTAIATGKVPQKSWFTLGRLITEGIGSPVLLSWSGSMFEYLMPQLVMPTYEGTLLQDTAKAVVKNQIRYASRRNVPWGISESAYNLVDTSLNYQYQAFGVPGLGLKRGLGDDLVIAPYATAMAMMVDPVAASDNLSVLDKKGFMGRYGFYEAIDYTASRLPRGETHVLIRSFMVHHQGMAFLSFAYFLLHQKMQERFVRDAQFRSALLLLQERASRASVIYAHATDASEANMLGQQSYTRVIRTPNTPMPQVQLLSNGKYQVAVSNAGGGYSRWRNIALNRWREDTTLDNWGIFCYIKDVDSGQFWTNTYQPSLARPKEYEVIFSQGHVEFRRMDGMIETKTDIVVSPEDDVEIRRIRIANRSTAAKTFEITSYVEVVLAPQASDEAHPAFSNLFVQTGIDEKAGVIKCTRRPRSKDEVPPWMFHFMSFNRGRFEDVSYETDRMRFIGRNNSVQAPAAITGGGKMSGHQGAVLDAVMAIRYKITLQPKSSASFDLVMGVAASEAECSSLVNKYQDRFLKDRAFELSWTHSQVLLKQINANEDEAQLFATLAGAIIYANAKYRATSPIIKSNTKGQSGLWGYAISGDLPIVLVRVTNSENIAFVKQLIRAHTYWRMKGLSVDLIIWNEDYSSYRQEFHDEIVGFVSVTSGAVIDQPGGVFVRSGDQIANEDRILFQTVARVILTDTDGSLREQINKQLEHPALPPLLKTGEKRYPVDKKQQVSLPLHLIFQNGLGGFTQDGKEYVLEVSRNKTTPAPWCNILANPSFGSMLSESGSAYTWADNAQAFRLTPWMNDPVSDGSGEAFYIRDEETGSFWSPTPAPCISDMPFVVHQGFGYSVYEHIEDGIKTKMCAHVDVEAPVKFIRIKIKNLSGRQRRLSATGYVEWVMGDMAAKTRMYVTSEKDRETGVLFIRNKYNTVFAEKVCFLDCNSAEKSFTCDRTEFIGRNGSLSNPEAMRREKLSGRNGAAYDPCSAIQVYITLAEKEEKEIVFILGAGANEHHARELVQQFKDVEIVKQSLEKVHQQWTDILGRVHVHTPDEAYNVMANGWLLYQTLSCRIWGRSGFYQSGGAYGFRDQLQDVLAVMHARPDVARQQIVLAASRQFREGDVQHWWHPPSGRGVRTTCSDDYLWLPFVTARYIETTGDAKILDEYISYIDGRPLHPGEESYYDLPVFLDHWETLYNHCKKAIRYGLKFGKNGLPLMGSGDWNDGMDKVGEHGQGESVWLGFFLYTVLQRFGSIAAKYGDAEFHAVCMEQANRLRDNIQKNAWDGQWYRRAYFDDGTPLGSVQNEECRIDSISQSWSVLSGAGTPDRTGVAMESLNKYLVDRKNRIIKLLDPPFDKSSLNPGYIKGYVPGVRENGGQYTHAAIWAMMAFADMKDNERVWELFSMVNPVNHGKSASDVQQYKVEPYVMAADVYGAPPNEGRGGWTWYTGSAGWTYQLAVEYIAGIRRRGDKLYLNPCAPAVWGRYKVVYRYEDTHYHIIVHNRKTGVLKITLDNHVLQEGFINLQNDGQAHQVEAEI
ncbi:MAG: glucoamylase family protein [Niabella sp.]